MGLRSSRKFDLRGQLEWNICPGTWCNKLHRKVYLVNSIHRGFHYCFKFPLNFVISKCKGNKKLDIFAFLSVSWSFSSVHLKFHKAKGDEGHTVSHFEDCPGSLRPTGAHCPVTAERILHSQHWPPSGLWIRHWTVLQTQNNDGAHSKRKYRAEWGPCLWSSPCSGPTQTGRLVSM